MSSKADRSILKTISLDVTRSETVNIDDLLSRTAITRKKKRVSFNESIAVKEILNRLDLQRLAVESAIDKAQNQENASPAAPPPSSLIGITPVQKRQLKNFLQWSMNEEVKRLSAEFQTDDEEKAAPFSGPLAPKLTGNRHLSFYVDPDDDDERIADEQAFHAAEMTILNQTVAPSNNAGTDMLSNSHALLPNDDFSRFLRGEDVMEDIDMDISEIHVPRGIQEASNGVDTGMVNTFGLPQCASTQIISGPLTNVHEDIMDLSSEASKDFSFESVLKPISSKSKPPVPPNLSLLNQSTVSNSGPKTFTILKNQSSLLMGEDEEHARDEHCSNLLGANQSWNQPPSQLSAMMELSNGNISAISTASKAHIGNQSLVNLHVPVPPIPCENFNSPLRRDRRRTFVVVDKTEREKRHERILRERASLEPFNNVNTSQNYVNNSMSLEPKLTNKSKQQQMQPAEDLSQPACSQQSITSSQQNQRSQWSYKYQLPHDPNHPNPFDLIKFFFENKGLDVGSFQEALESAAANYHQPESVVSLWESTARENPDSAAILSPSRPNVVGNVSFSWTPVPGDITVMSPLCEDTPTLPSTALCTPTLSIFEEKYRKAKEAMDLISEKIRMTSKMVLPSAANSNETLPELLSRLMPEVRYRRIEKSGCQIWTFPCKQGTCSLEVHVKEPCPDTLSPSIEAAVHLLKSPYGGVWMSRFGEIGIEFMACRLGMPHGKRSFSRRFADEAEVESFLLKINDIYQSAYFLITELITAATKRLFYDAEENFKIIPAVDDEGLDDPTKTTHLIIELSAFPVLAITPGSLEICSKATVLLDLDLKSYPSPGSMTIADATIVGGVDMSSQVVDIISEFENGARAVFAEPGVTIERLSELMCSLRQVY